MFKYMNQQSVLMLKYMNHQ